MSTVFATLIGLTDQLRSYISRAKIGLVEVVIAMLALGILFLPLG